MDFSNRVAQQQPAANHAAAGATGANRKNTKGDDGKLGRILAVVGAVLVALLLVFAIVRLATNDGGAKESSYVDSSKLQAVFLNTGQVYFGNVKAMNSKYLQLTNIYYLQTSQNGGTNGQNANTSVSLVKLGCELHEPFDKMIINRDSVTFWENLKTDGQVAKAVDKFQKENPNGQQCANQAATSTTPSTNSAQPAGTSNTTKP